MAKYVKRIIQGSNTDRVLSVLCQHAGYPISRRYIEQLTGVHSLDGLLASIENHHIVAEDDDGQLIYMGRRKTETRLEREMRLERERREHVCDG